MRTVLSTFLCFALALTNASARSDKDKPVKSAVPLSADEIAIYRSVLGQFLEREVVSLNVSSRTYPLDLSSPMSGFLDRACSQGIQLDNLASVSHSYHELIPDLLVVKKMKLVDPDKQGKLVHKNDPSKTIRSGKSVDDAVKEAFGTGLFSLSEIAFDKEHHFGVVSYSFWCGSLCGNGATLVFESIGGEWKNSGRQCGGWVS
jgi:hypothetical protein